MNEIKVKNAARKNVHSLRALFNSVKEMDAIIESVSKNNEKKQLKKQYSKIVESLNSLIESYEEMMEAAKNDEESE